LDDELKEKYKSNEENKNKFKKQKIELKIKIKELGDVIEEKNKNINTFQKVIEDLNKKNEFLQLQLNNSNFDLNEKQKQIELHKINVKHDEDEILSLKESIENLKKENYNNNDYKKILNEENINLNTTIILKNKENEDLESKIKILNRDLFQKKERIEMLNKEIQSFELINNKNEKLIVDGEFNIKELNNEIEKLKKNPLLSEMNKFLAFADHQSKRDIELSNYENKIKELESQEENFFEAEQNNNCNGIKFEPIIIGKPESNYIIGLIVKTLTTENTKEKIESFKMISDMLLMDSKDEKKVIDYINGGFFSFFY